MPGTKFGGSRQVIFSSSGQKIWLLLFLKKFMNWFSTENDLSAVHDLVTRFSLVFGPSVEPAGPDAFLTDSPENVMEKGDFAKVPVILGCCVKEGSLYGFIELNEGKFAFINENPSAIVPSFLGLKPGSVEEKQARKEICDYYLKGKPVSWDNIYDYLCVSRRISI
ncbi:hypothetical protein J6590_088954 [Homalodisca vitripennis]|nr:hypothetical protein J6590_088954 [Homalodisca vitripennis]